MTTLALRGPALRRPNPFAKYAAIATSAVRVRLGERAPLLSRALFYALVLFIFDRVWAKLGQRGSGYVWYLAVTEWVMLSQPRLFQEIERDVRSGEIAYQLTRPTSYLGVKLSEAAGELSLSMAWLGAIGVGMATLLHGGLPVEPVGLLYAAALGVLAGLVLLLCNALIGLLAFWLDDVSPLYWLWQKSMFVLGGLFVPLSLYPDWLRLVALWSPFSALVSGPGSMAIDPDPKIFALLVLKLVGCALLAQNALERVMLRGLRRLALNGG
jgi:ABC-2 type transport system permease protein